MPVPPCFRCCSSVVTFEVKKCKSSSFVLFFQDLLAIYTLCISMWILRLLCQFLQNCWLGFWTGISLNPWSITFLTFGTWSWVILGGTVALQVPKSPLIFIALFQVVSHTTRPTWTLKHLNFHLQVSSYR